MSFKMFSFSLIELMNKIADEDFNEIVNSYSVPAERIVRSLKMIKDKHLKVDPKSEIEIDFAIMKILERTLYDVD